jgi:hypothetical protein
MTSLSEIYSALLSGVQGINNLTQTIAKTLPQITTSSTAAPASPGAISFNSSQATGFILVQTSSGSTVKVATYSDP